jgi:hypothetical protein
VSEPFYDPTDPDRRPKPLDYATGTRRGTWVDAVGRGCLIALVVVVLLVGVVFGTCVFMR